MHTWCSIGITVAILAFGTDLAQARRQTYCVSGYFGKAPFVTAPCGSPSERLSHLPYDWHLHTYVRKGGQCFVCYDEKDNSCTTDFLRNHPQYRAADYGTCRSLGEMNSAEVIANVVGGQDIAAPAPPPAELSAGIDSVTPGPYTAGDTITVVGSLRDDSGHVRNTAGGTLRVKDPRGNVLQEVAGTVRPDGTVAADLVLPAAAGLHLEFEPNVLPLADGESVASRISDPLALRVEVCGMRARVVFPHDGSPLASGQAVTLRAALFDAVDRTPIATPPGTKLEFTVQVLGDKSRTLAADSNLEARWVPPAAPKAQTGSLYVSGTAGSRVICHGAEVEVTISDLGVGFDTSDLPTVCYTGLPCNGTVRLVRPEPGPERQRVDALLADSDVQVVLLDGTREISAGPARPNDKYTFDITPQAVRHAPWRLEIRRPRGVVDMPPHEVRIRPPLVLDLADSIDFGEVPAGSALISTQQKLDFSASQAASEHRFRVALVGVEDCLATPKVASENIVGLIDAVPLTPYVEIDALDAERQWLDLVLDVPRCAGEASPPAAALEVIPLTPEFADQVAIVRLEWTVTERDWLSCHGAWIWPASIVSLGLFLVVGVVRPHRFPPGATIRVGGSLKGLKQAPRVNLRDLPGSGSGFYRSARLGIHFDGSVNGSTRNAQVVLRATAEGVVVIGMASLEVQAHRTRKWASVDGTAAGQLPTSRTVFRAGDNYFRVEPG